MLEPLSNFQIIDECKKLEIENLRNSKGGMFMRNELNESRSTKNECLIINIDHSDNPGTHWTCLFIIFFFISTNL